MCPIIHFPTNLEVVFRSVHLTQRFCSTCNPISHMVHPFFLLYFTWIASSLLIRSVEWFIDWRAGRVEGVKGRWCRWKEEGLVEIWSVWCLKYMKQSYKIHLVHLLALCVYRNKGRGWGWRGGEKREEKAGPEGERGGWKRGEGPLRLSFLDSFYSVASKADLQHHPTLKPPSRRSVQWAPPSSSSVLCVAKRTVIGYSFMRLISALSPPPPPPTGRGPFCCPSEVSAFVCMSLICQTGGIRWLKPTCGL